MLEHSAKVSRGQSIFVHGLSGAVGTALLHLARLRQAKVYGTAAANKHDALRTAGAVPFDYRQKKWIAEMQRIGGVDAVFDPLGYQSFDESYSILRKGGLLVGYGQNLPALTNTPRPAPLPMNLKLFARNLAFWAGKRPRTLPSQHTFATEPYLSRVVRRMLGPKDHNLFGKCGYQI